MSQVTPCSAAIRRTSWGSCKPRISGPQGNCPGRHTGTAASTPECQRTRENTLAPLIGGERAVGCESGSRVFRHSTRRRRERKRGRGGSTGAPGGERTLRMQLSMHAQLRERGGNLCTRLPRCAQLGETERGERETRNPPSGEPRSGLKRFGGGVRSPARPCR